MINGRYMMKKSWKKIGLTLVIGLVSSIHFSAVVPDEGMFPLSDLDRAGLKAAGLKIDEKDIYNPGQVGLVDALVRVGGCSGSFVSEEGLIITNHHCTFSAVQLASTPQQDYLTHGFMAERREQEIPAQGLSIRITESYEDVSDQVLGAARGISDPAERLRVIEAKRQELARAAEAADPAIRAEVSEMFIGKSYVLFRYRTIEDVRLVYIPRQNIGEFGGETDNWVWPRHTGDFAFLRAYVAPDGSAASFATENVPYQPKKHLKINPAGVDEEDFVFILGYPGRTFRHRPAQYVEYQERFLLPYISELNDFQNQRMMEAGAKDKAIELQLATRIKRNANVMKNYRGKMKGLRNIGIVQNKRKEDQDLANFIKSSTELQEQYGTLMQDIDQLYQSIFEDAYKEMWLGQIYNSTTLLQVARQLHAFRSRLNSLGSESAQREFYEANIEALKTVLGRIYGSYNSYADAHIFGKMLSDARTFTGSNRIPAVVALGLADEAQAFQYAENLIRSSKLNDFSTLEKEVLGSAQSIMTYQDELLAFQQALAADIAAFAPEQERREGVLNQLMGDYVAVKELFQERAFVPDANSTLRLTFGHIRGYSPVDASYMHPITTVRGVIEKGMSDDPEFDYPVEIRERWQEKDFGPYVKDDLGDVPVNILYDMDTTGGNSGSPIMNAYGELIGVNFDRAYDATINDFAWDQDYSRSIGVDIRYVLWVADKIDGAEFLLKELKL